MKTNFLPYKVGKVFNPLKGVMANIKPVYRNIVIRFPSRLNAMAIDPSKIAKNKNLVYTPGEVVFSVCIFKTAEIKIIKEGNTYLKISKNSKRQSLIKHAYMLMQKALGFKEKLYINVNNEHELCHCGLGSSSGLIATVACAINEIYGNPINNSDLVRYLAQNHGEEIKGEDDLINPVQCIGGSAAAGVFKGGLLILAGESCLIKTMDIPNEYKVIIGIPEDFNEKDSSFLLTKEVENLDKFIRTGRKFAPEIAYNVFHKLLPAMTIGDLKTVGDIIFDYRFNMGSIKNCSFVYPRMVSLSNKLSFLKKKQIADVLSLSSVGPAFFVITKKLRPCLETFKKLSMKTIVTQIENEKYKIIKKSLYKKCAKK